MKIRHNPHVPDLSLPVSEVGIYKVLGITDLPDLGSEERDLDGPIQLLDESPEAGPEPHDGPATGVLLTYEQAWRNKGVALGRLHHSLCLAPGEVTQIAVTEWSRTTSGSATEAQAAHEVASKSADRQRETRIITEAVARETHESQSSTDTSASSSSVGSGLSFGLLGLSSSLSHAGSHGRSAEYQVGVRDVAANSLNDVRQSTHQQAANARSRNASLLQEVTESESESTMTRVVANYNHMHALNMQYYEVVQVFELTSRVTAAERCIFLPMKVMEFNQDTVSRHAGALIEATRILGRPILTAALKRLQGAANPQKSLDHALREKKK